MSWIWTTQGLMCCAMLSHSVVSHYLRSNGSIWPTTLLCPWGCSRQEYRSGLPCHPPGDLPNSGIEARSHTPGHRVLFRDNLVVQTGIPNILSEKYLLLAPWRWAWDHLWTSYWPVSKQNWEWSPDKKVEPWLCFNCYIPSHLKICLGLG